MPSYNFVTWYAEGCYMHTVPIYIPTPKPVQSTWNPPVASVQKQSVATQAWESVRQLLTAQEKRLLARYDYLPIESRLHPGFFYRLHMDGYTPEVVYRNEVVGSVCLAFVRRGLPAADSFLMHKLWIEADEEDYLRRGNVLRYWDTPPACAWLDRK